MNFSRYLAFLFAFLSLSAFAEILCIDKTPSLDMLHDRDIIHVEIFRNQASLNRGRPSVKADLSRVDGGLDGAYNEFTFEDSKRSIVANFKVPREANVAYPTIVELGGSSFSLNLDYKNSIVLDMDCFSMRKD